MSDELSSPSEADDLVRLGASANLAARYAAEGRQFVGQLASMLEATLGDDAQIERRGGLFGAKTLSKISVRLGDATYVLDVPKSGAPVAARVKVVRGIALKTETLPMNQWLREVGERLSQRASHHRQTSEALERLMGDSAV